MKQDAKPHAGLPHLGIGCGSLANAGGAEAFAAMVAAAIDAGIRYFDTAALYLGGESERRLGEALAARGHENIKVSTKVGRTQQHVGSSIDPSGKASTFDYSRDATMRSVELSLRQIGVDRLDLVMIHDLTRDYHGENYGRRFDEAMSGAYPALVQLKQQGVVGAIGVALMEWEACMDFGRAAPFDAFMPAGQYSLLHRDGAPLLEHCGKTGSAFIAASPFNSGILATGAKEGAFHNMRLATHETLERVRGIEAICQRHDVPLAAAALRFPLRHPAVSTVVFGSNSAAELHRNMELMETAIPDAMWDELDADAAAWKAL